MFAEIYAPAPATGGDRFASQSQPRPFVLSAPTADLEEGAQISFKIGLFGKALRFLPQFTTAVLLLADQGLTRKQYRFRLDRVDCVDPCGKAKSVVVYDRAGDSDSRSAVYPRVDMSAAETLWGGQRTEHVSLNVLSATQIAAGKRVVDDAPSFEQLVRALLRRYSDLSELYGDGRPDFDYKALLSDAMSVRGVHNEIEPSKSRIYSTRKNSPTPIAGFTGLLEFEGDLDQFMPLLLFGQWMHVGKQTTFGMGRYVVS